MMNSPYPRMIVLALAVGLAGITAGCAHSGHDEAAPADAVPRRPVASSPAVSVSAPPVVPPAASAANPPRQAGTGPQRAMKATPAAPAARCSGRGLTAGLEIGNLSGSTQSAALSVRNTTAQPCTLSGFPDLQLLGHGEDPISTLVVHTGSAGTLQLSPGATAWAPLTWSTAPATDEPAGGCEPSASRLAVFAPGDSTQINLDYSAGPICGHGRIAASAFRAGAPTP